MQHVRTRAETKTVRNVCIKKAERKINPSLKTLANIIQVFESQGLSKVVVLTFGDGRMFRTLYLLSLKRRSCVHHKYVSET